MLGKITGGFPTLPPAAVMLAYLVAFGVLLHVFFWGAGLAILAMPAPWRRFWPILAPVAGAAAQSLVVWVGAYANLRGTDRYAWVAELIALALLAAGLRRRGWGVWRDLARLGAVWVVTAACLVALVRPLARAASGLTTASLGSCDAADYAAGARVLKEFARGDRGGFLGLTEVVRVQSVDNFFDFWLKLNHFTPSALIAFNGTIFHCAPYEITGLMAMALLAAAVPVVFWVARSLLCFPAAASVGIAALFGFSPVMGYAAAHVALGQLLAAPAVALLTWAGVCLWRTGCGRRYFPVLAIAYGLLLGCYNFFIIVCFVPAAAYASLDVARRAEFGRLGRWLVGMALPLAMAGAVFWARVAGLAERFRLFRTYDFGWAVPGLSPEGWLGMISGPDLAPLAMPVRLVLAGLVAAALAAALWSAGAGRLRLAVSFAGPVLLGYGYLLWRGFLLHTHASYDAYKLFSVFYPLLLPVFCLWTGLWGRGPRLTRLAAAALAALVVGMNLAAAVRFSTALSAPPLIVDRELIQLRTIESMPQVHSVNMQIPDMWSRLWANAFLLKKPQYFLTHTYEGRLNTPLRGEWDLGGGVATLSLPGSDSVRINSHYFLARVGSPYFLRVSFDAGWYPPERLPRAALQWRWSSGDASLILDNPQARPLKLSLRLDAGSLVDRDLELWAGGARVGAVAVGPQRRMVALPEIVIAPGITRLELRSIIPPSGPPAGDSRRLGFVAYGIDVEVLPDGAGSRS